MKKCNIIIIIMLLMFASIVSSADICEDTLDIGFNCTMLTPVLDCATNYTVYNYTGTPLTNGSMIEIGGGVYNFTFSEDEGSYIVVLCDNSSREIIVEASDTMNIAIIITLSLFGILFIGIGLYILLRNRNDD